MEVAEQRQRLEQRLNAAGASRAARLSQAAARAGGQADRARNAGMLKKLTQVRLMWWE